MKFNLLRSLLWPIYRHETKKLLPMVIMLFLLSFNQSTLWNLKDALVVTTSGAEIIPFIKVWAILPSTIFLTWIFTYLSNKFSQEKVFYLLTSSFLFFYGLFAFIIYPYRDQLHPTESANFLEMILPLGFKGLVSMYRHWTFTGFYVICELWNTMVISILFWGFANVITHTTEGGRFYGVLSIAYNLAIIAAGLVSIAIAQYGVFNTGILLGHGTWEQTMMLLMIVVITNGLLIMGVFRWMHKKVLTQPKEKIHQKEDKLSLRECLQHVGQSRYLICIAVMVVGYSLVINMAEVIWKDQLRSLYPTTLDYNRYINVLQVIQGALAVVLSLVIANLIRFFGWTPTALATPVIMLLLCGLFFSAMFFPNAVGVITPLTTVVFIGALQNSFSKACKYSIFDSTKEMAFIPLSFECKLKGKTAIDGIGYRFGKSGGSLILQGLLLLFSSVSASTPYAAVILLAVLLIWIYCVNSLAKTKEIKSLECTIPTEWQTSRN